MMGNTVDEHAHKFLEPPNCAEVQNGQNSRSGGAPGSLLGLFVLCYSSLVSDSRVKPALHKPCGKVCIPEPTDLISGYAGDMFKCPECGGEWTRYAYVQEAGFFQHGYATRIFPQ